MQIRDALRARGAWVILAAALVVGHFAPWLQHASSALTLSAHELATFTNFTPNAGIFFNEGFMMPLWAAAVLLAAGTCAGAWRWPGLAAALFLSALGLPGYPELRNLSTSPFVWQAAAAVLVGAAVLALAIWPKPAILRWIPALAGLSSLVALAGFLAIKSRALEPLYGGHVGLGWGWWLTLFTFIAAVLVAFVTIFVPRTSSR